MAPVPGPAKPLSRLSAYVRLGFGAAVLFGIVGSLSGHQTGSMLVFIVTALCWTVSRIVVEAFQAYVELTSQSPKPPKNDPPADPPADPPTAIA